MEALNRYFKHGNLSFKAFRIADLPAGTEPAAGMMICNDRRWPEAWRCLGLQGVELVLCGYNTAGFASHLWGSNKSQDPEEAEQTAIFHHKLVMQSNSYMNATFAVCAARAGMDDGLYHLIGGSCIVGREGDVLAEAKTVEDEIVIADCDLDLCKQGKSRTFDFSRHHRVEHYQRIVEQTGVITPPRLKERQRPGSDTETSGDFCSSGSVASVPPCQYPEQIRKIRILLRDPNATTSMTDNCVKTIQPTLPPDVEVIGFTAPHPAPSAIEGNFDNICSAAAAARAILPMQHRDHIDAILVACYSDHALIRMLREEFNVPVIGIMEASLFAARTLSGRFGIIATSYRSKVLQEEALRHYGMESFCAGVESCNVAVLDLERKPGEQVLALMGEIGKTLAAQGARRC